MFIDEVGGLEVDNGWKTPRFGRTEEAGRDAVNPVYRTVHPEGYVYSRFTDLFRGFERRLTPAMRRVHVAGNKVFVDYSGKKLPIVDRKTGEVREAEIFLGVLGALSYTYAEATWSQTLPDWIGSHVRMFRFLTASRD